ncbi:MAG: ATPase domain-containing protein [Thermoplasmata archaeon]
MVSTRSSSGRGRRAEVSAFSAETAKLQLRIGRSAHGYGVIAALILTMNAILAYLLEVSEIFLDPPFSWAALLLWILPMVVGIGVGISALSLKWEHYSYERASGHFILTVLGILIPSIGLAVVLVSELGFYGFQYLPWIYPVSLLGLSLTMVSMAMTWRGKGLRKVTSIISVLVPIVLIVLIMVVSSSPLGYLPLVMGYLGSAICFQIGGSILHVLASSTSAQERHIIRANRDRLTSLQKELESRRALLDYKEKALVGREAHLESYEQQLARTLMLVESRRKELAEFQMQIDKRESELLAMEKRIGALKADADVKMNELELVKGELKASSEKSKRVREDLTRTAAAISKRETRLKRSEIQLEAKMRELTSLEKAMTKEKKRHEQIREELSRKRNELIVRERELNVLAQEVSEGESRVPATEGEAVSLEEWEKRLGEKEQELGELNLRLDSLASELEQREADANEQESALAERLEYLKDREEKTLNKELELADLESKLEGEREILRREKTAMNEEKNQLQERGEKYRELAAEARKRMTDYDSLKEEVETKEIELQHKEKTVRDLEARLERESKSIDEKMKDLIEREKELEDKEAMVNLRVLDSERYGIGGPKGLTDHEEMEKTLRIREERLRAKERELKNWAYQREKELELREGALQQKLKEELADREELVIEEKQEEKVKTGISRLDDLLYGGFPFNSNVLFVGPSFLGKEVAILNFIAEGLRKGIPAVIVTTSKPPEEIAKDMGPVLMEFVEYERIGLVKWIDATSQVPPESAGFDEGKRIYRVNGAADMDKILEGLQEIETTIGEEHPYFRIAYLSLSPTVSRSEKNVAYEFIQRMVNDLRKTRFVGAFALEKGMHDQKEIETIEHQMDGAIMFKQDDKKTFLSVHGVCNVQTRDWVEYKQTDRGLLIGAFSLERIK